MVSDPPLPAPPPPHTRSTLDNVHPRLVWCCCHLKNLKDLLQHVTFPWLEGSRPPSSRCSAHLPQNIYLLPSRIRHNMSENCKVTVSNLVFWNFQLKKSSNLKSVESKWNHSTTSGDIKYCRLIQQEWFSLEKLKCVFLLHVQWNYSPFTSSSPPDVGLYYWRTFYGAHDSHAAPRSAPRLLISR